MILENHVWFGGMHGQIRGEHGRVSFFTRACDRTEELGQVKADLYFYPAAESIPSQTFRLLFKLGLVEYRLGDRAGGLPPRWRWKGVTPQAVRGAA